MVRIGRWIAAMVAAVECLPESRSLGVERGIREECAVPFRLIDTIQFAPRSRTADGIMYGKHESQ